eukprot:scaffold1964_cov76-Skeletonema_dohrnii-CCMP3373.AAC.1
MQSWDYNSSRLKVTKVGTADICNSSEELFQTEEKLRLDGRGLSLAVWGAKRVDRRGSPLNGTSPRQPHNLHATIVIIGRVDQPMRKRVDILWGASLFCVNGWRETPGRTEMVIREKLQAVLRW